MTFQTLRWHHHPQSIARFFITSLSQAIETTQAIRARRLPTQIGRS